MPLRKCNLSNLVQYTKFFCHVCLSFPSPHSLSALAFRGISRFIQHPVFLEMWIHFSIRYIHDTESKQYAIAPTCQSQNKIFSSRNLEGKWGKNEGIVFNFFNNLQQCCYNPYSLQSLPRSHFSEASVPKEYTHKKYSLKIMTFGTLSWAKKLCQSWTSNGYLHLDCHELIESENSTKYRCGKYMNIWLAPWSLNMNWYFI